MGDIIANVVGRNSVFRIRLTTVELLTNLSTHFLHAEGLAIEMLRDDPANRLSYGFADGFPEARLESGNSAFVSGNARKALFAESIPDRKCETEGNEFTEHLLAVATKVDAIEEILLASHDIADFERAHDLAKLGGGHGPNITGLEIGFDVFDELVRIPEPVKGFVVAALADEVVREVHNVLSHFYLLSRDFPLPVWIATPRHSERCDMSQRRTH